MTRQKINGRGPIMDEGQHSSTVALMSIMKVAERRKRKVFEHYTPFRRMPVPLIRHREMENMY